MSGFTFNHNLASSEGAAPGISRHSYKKKTGRSRKKREKKGNKKFFRDGYPYGKPIDVRTPRQQPKQAAARATVESKVGVASSFKLDPDRPEWTPSASSFKLDPDKPEWTPWAQSLKFISKPSTNINNLLGQSFYHINATNMRVIPNNQNILYPKNNIYGNFSNDACLKLLKYLTVTTLNSNSNNLHSTEAFIILNDTIFYGYGFKNLQSGGNVPIHVETFLMLNLVKAIEKGKIRGVDSITIYSTLQPCCMCSLIIHQGIMYLRKLLNSDILCNIFYCNKDGAMKPFTRPGPNQPPSYWNYNSRSMRLTKGQQGNQKTKLINHLCLVPGQTGSQIRLGANDYTLRQMFERGQNVPTKDALNLLKKKFFHSDTTKLIIVGDNYRTTIGSEINVSYQPYNGRKGTKMNYLQQITQDTETFKLVQIINYFYLNYSGFDRFGMNGGTYNIIGNRKIDTFLSGFTLLNAPPDCPLRQDKYLKTPTGTTTAKAAAAEAAATAAAATAAAATGKGSKPPPNLRACSIPTYQVNNLINENIYLNNLIIPDQSQKESVALKSGMSAAAAGRGGYKKTKNKRKKRRNKKTIKKKRKRSRKTLRKKLNKRNKKTKRRR